jgi:hypothetical protein
MPITVDAYRVCLLYNLTLSNRRLDECLLEASSIIYIMSFFLFKKKRKFKLLHDLQYAKDLTAKDQWI